MLKLVSKGILQFIFSALAFQANAENYLTEKNIETIKSHWEDYKYGVETVRDLPVEIMPAIHYRESGLLLGWYSSRHKKVRHNVGGPFMLDCGGKGIEFNNRIRKYEISIFRKYGGIGEAPRVSSNFRFAALVAAHELKTKMRGKGLSDAVWGYNGRSKMVTFRENAYLWNHPLIGRRMLVKYRFNGKLIEYLDERPGVMVIYNEVIKLRKSGSLP